MYHVDRLETHYYNGDPGGETDIEILPHPYCDFCKISLFNDVQLGIHMSKDHFVCHVCGDKHKHIYYKNYKELEQHFDKTHFLCPDPNC